MMPAGKFKRPKGPLLLRRRDIPDLPLTRCTFSPSQPRTARLLSTLSIQQSRHVRRCTNTLPRIPPNDDYEHIPGSGGSTGFAKSGQSFDGKLMGVIWEMPDAMTGRVPGNSQSESEPVYSPTTIWRADRPSRRWRKEAQCCASSSRTARHQVSHLKNVEVCSVCSLNGLSYLVSTLNTSL